MHQQNKTYFFNNVRLLMILGVIILHACYPFRTINTSDPVDKSILFDIISFYIDIFIMPVLFFVAGYFALFSLKKKGALPFIAAKLKRIGLPWLFGIFTFAPLYYYLLKLYQNENQVAFLTYWLDFFRQAIPLTGGIRPVLLQAQFWFLGVLLAFFIFFALFYHLYQTLFPGIKNNDRQNQFSPGKTSLLLILFGSLTVGLYFVTLLLISRAGSNEFTLWINISNLVEFQPSRLPLYICYFILGIYGAKKNWFVENKIPGRLWLWSILTLLMLLATFVLIETPMKAKPDSIELLLFCIFRNFFLLAFILTVIKFCQKYYSGTNQINHLLVAQSYSIYMVHLVILAPIQHFLIQLNQPILIQFIIGAALTTIISALIAQYIMRRIIIFNLK